MTDVVSFTRMQDGTAEDYALLDRIEAEELRSFPDRVLGWLLTMKDTAGYQISRLDHSLQAATRAHRAGEDEETVVCTLLHDIGDYLAPANHSEVAAAMLRPYVSEKNYWIVKHHRVFQAYYYFPHAGMDRNVRDRWRDHEHYQATVDFCANYDQNSFDPGYDSEPLSFCHVPQPVDRLTVIGRRGQQQLDLVERQARALAGVDYRQGAHGVVVVAALPGHAGRWGQQPDLLVVADRGRALARKGGQLADGQQRGTARPGIGV